MTKTRDPEAGKVVDLRGNFGFFRGLLRGFRGL